jgi:predicted amidohydrolase YtcJ
MTVPAGQADLVVLSERLITMAGNQPDHDGFAVADGLISQYVSRQDVPALISAGAKVVDAGARPVLPGFIDVHAHSEVAATAAFGTVDCRAPECRTVDDVLGVLSAGIRDRSTDWLVGQANLFFDRKISEGRLPTREELDRVSTNVPIALRAGGHITVLNSVALDLAGISSAYRPPAHSITGKPAVERDLRGEPTGVVREMDNLLPFGRLDRTQQRAAIQEGIATLFTRNGVTTIGEISETVQGIRDMDALAVDGGLPVRIRLYLWAPGTMSLKEIAEWPRHLQLRSSPDQLTARGIKVFSDGGFSASSAAVSHEYVHRPGFNGDIALRPEEFAEVLAVARAADLQLAVHANGDRAQRWVCEQLIASGGATGPRNRTRIEHAGNLVPGDDLVELWRQADIHPVPQPVFLYTFGDYFVDYLGGFGSAGRFPLARLTAGGWRLSASSDVWVGSEREATNPLFGMWCAIRRKSFDGNLIDTAEALTVEQALRMYTIDAAYTLGEEAEKGSIEPGKKADFIVLDRDPRQAAVDDIPGIHVHSVFVGGRQVHPRPARAS